MSTPGEPGRSYIVFYDLVLNFHNITSTVFYWPKGSALIQCREGLSRIVQGLRFYPNCMLRSWPASASWMLAEDMRQTRGCLLLTAIAVARIIIAEPRLPPIGMKRVRNHLHTVWVVL